MFTVIIIYIYIYNTKGDRLEMTSTFDSWLDKCCVPSHKTNQANVCAKRHWLRAFKPQTKHPHLSKPICQLKIRSSDLAPATPSQGFCQVSHVD